MSAWTKLTPGDKTTVVFNQKVLIKFEDDHIEDAMFFEMIDGDWGYMLFDGETLTTLPVAWAYIPE